MVRCSNNKKERISSNIITFAIQRSFKGLTKWGINGSLYVVSYTSLKNSLKAKFVVVGVCKVNYLHRQDNSNVPVVAHQVEDQDTSSEMTVCRYHRVTGLHPLHIPHSNPDVHPKKHSYI